MSEAPQAAQETPNAAEAEIQAKPGEAQAEAKPEQKEQPAPTEKAKTPDGEAAPTKYELKVPEGSQLQAADLEKIALFAKEQGLSNVQAQKLVEREAQVLSAYVQGQSEQLKTQTQAWIKDLETDKEVGGAQFSENMEIAHRAVKKFADPEFVKILEETGLGNNPGLVRAFWRIGKQMVNDKMVTPGPANAGRPPLADRLYGNKNK